MTSIENFAKYLNFLKEVVKRDINRKYYKSALGILWTILYPLITMIIITIIFSTLFQRAVTNYPVYYFSASLLFGLLTESTRSSIHSIVGNAALIKKMYIPKYMFCLSNVIVGIVNMLFSLISFILIIIFTNHKLNFYALLFPIPIIYTIIFSTGLSLVLSSSYVYFRDLNHLYGIVITLWTYITPIFYPIRIIPEKFIIIWELNPMYHIVQIFRDCVYLGTMPSERSLIIATSYSILTLIWGIVTFKQKEKSFFLHI